MRSYKKVYFKLTDTSLYPAFYANIGEVPGQQPDAVYAMLTRNKQSVIDSLNRVYNIYITTWGWGPESVPPGSPNVSPLINELGEFFPLINYLGHPKN